MGWWGYSIEQADDYYSYVDKFLSLFDSYICKDKKAKDYLIDGIFSWNCPEIVNKAIERISLKTNVAIHLNYIVIKNKKKCTDEISDEIVEKCLMFEAIAVFINNQPKIKIEKPFIKFFDEAFHILKKSKHTEEFASPNSRKKALDKTLKTLKTKLK